MVAIQCALVILLILIIIQIDFQQCQELYAQGQLAEIEWDNPGLREIYKLLLEKFGVPSQVNPQKSGGTQWYAARPYSKILLSDVPDKPLCVWYPLKLFMGYHNVEITEQARAHKCQELTKFCRASAASAYDIRRETLTVKTDNWKNLLLVLLISTQISRNTLTLEEVKEGGLLRDYNKMSLFDLEGELKHLLAHP